MKCNPPFIYAYNNLFNFLRNTGCGNLEAFWNLLEEAILGRLRYLAETEGLVGMTKYWSETLTAEDADFVMTYNNGETKSLTIDIRTCPSLKAISLKGIPMCVNYCDHCHVMYQKALKRYGYEFKIINKDGGCLIRIE